MKKRVPALVGTGGHVYNVVIPLDYGKTIVVGRSRKCTLSLRRTESYRKMVDEHGEATESFRTVSAKHFEVTMFNTNAIEIVNLSANGTVIDGKLQERVVIDDVTENEHEIRFGAVEVLMLKMEDIDISGDPDVLADQTAATAAEEIGEHVVEEDDQAVAQDIEEDDGVDSSDDDAQTDESDEPADEVKESADDTEVKDSDSVDDDADAGEDDSEKEDAKKDKEP